MPAGAATVAWSEESGFNGSLSSSTEWYQPGTNITVTGPSIARNQTRNRQPDDPRPQNSGVITDAEIVWSQGEDVRISLTISFADEPDGTSAPSDSDITQPSVDGVHAFHGADIDVGSTYQSLLSTMTLSLSNLARMRYGQSQIADSATIAGYEPSLSTDATFTESDQLTRALSGRSSGALVDTTTATIPFTNGNGDTIEYSVSGAQPESHDWSDLVNPDTELSEPTEYHVANVEVV